MLVIWFSLMKEITASRLVVLHPPFDHPIHGAGPGQALEDVRLVQIQDLGQVGGNKLVGGFGQSSVFPFSAAFALLSIRLLAGQDLFGESWML